ncbi:unnamed protein product [Toxocara canis]|uniref:G_PROTEIN_RECEP_F1_2 domain-containing protein n=1 Tax=Toxocara canis TaxID=6265 RepID=A0A183UNS3_TOXCA|nr:unnamed protein product [Toxocara canis]
MSITINASASMLVNSATESNPLREGSINCTGAKQYFFLQALTDFIITRLVFGIAYVLIFTLAVSGNSLVVYVVINNKTMQTVTNIFITNLAISDLLVNFTSLWLTPVYTYVGHWIWGGWLCYGLPLFQGTSIFISTLTLMAIAIDRYFVIVHHSSSSANVNDHMSMPVCIAIITLIWTVSLLLVMPYAVHMRMTYIPRPCDFWLCIEDWAMEDLKSMYGVIVMALQFLVPFVIIGFSYIQIWNFLNSRNSMVSQRESEYENARKKRLLRMLIIMVVVFGICWFPFNLLNILRDLHLDSFIKPYFSFLFLSAHVISMTATCWNPIVYAWMNEAFRERFIAAVPFLSRWFVSGRRNRPRVLADCDAVSERPKLCSTSGKGPSDAVLKPLIEHKSNAAGWNENACCSKWNRPSLHFYNGGPRFLENAKNSNDNKCLCTDEAAHGFGLTSKVEPNVTECEINCERQKPCPKHNSSSSLNELHSAHMPCTRFLSLDPHNRSTALLSSRSTQRRRIANDQRALFEMKTCIV